MVAPRLQSEGCEFDPRGGLLLKFFLAFCSNVYGGRRALNKFKIDYRLLLSGTGALKGELWYCAVPTSSSASSIVRVDIRSDVFFYHVRSPRRQAHPNPKPTPPFIDLASNRLSALLCSSTSLHNALRVVHRGS